MSVYIDPLFPCVPSRKWRWNSNAHLFADTEDKLHAFARKLILRRAWYQPDERLPHYDVTGNMRIKALALGAISVTRRRMVEHMRARQQRVEKSLPEITLDSSSSRRV